MPICWRGDACTWKCVAGKMRRQARGYIRILCFARQEGSNMYDGGALGGYTRWAVVFLIIFVLFILLVPYYTTTCTTTPVY